MTISYVEVNYKYRTVGITRMQLDFAPPEDIITDYVKFYTNGILELADSYCWNGASGPTYDDETNMQSSAGHDAGFQLMNMGLLDPKVYEPLFNKAFYKICLIDGMSRIRAKYYFAGVNTFGMLYAQRQEVNILTCGKPINLLVTK